VSRSDVYTALAILVVSLACLVAVGLAVRGEMAGTVAAGPFNYYHDAGHRVSCWYASGSGLSCLPDSEVTLP
jgi:hypothetical protein